MFFDWTGENERCAVQQTNLFQMLLLHVCCLYGKLVDFIHYLWIAPVDLAVICCLMWREIGNSCFVGLGIFVISMLSQFFVGRAFGRIRFVEMAVILTFASFYYCRSHHV